MKTIQNSTVDLILCDLPYGSTQNSWDIIIPFEDLWSEYDRILKKNGMNMGLLEMLLFSEICYLTSKNESSDDRWWYLLEALKEN